MPVKVKKVDHKYRVSTPSRVHAKGTTLEKAEAQARLLRALEHNPSWKPTGKPAKKKKERPAPKGLGKRLG